jgi:hypothetical protein
VTSESPGSSATAADAPPAFSVKTSHHKSTAIIMLSIVYRWYGASWYGNNENVRFRSLHWNRPIGIIPSLNGKSSIAVRQ